MQADLRGLKARLINHAILDPSFQSALSETASDIVEQSKSAINEASIESIFERTLYALLKQIGLPFHPEKQSPIETRRHMSKGRADSRLSGIVIEYKQPSTLMTTSHQRDASIQLCEYIDAISEKNEGPTVGYVTDGTKIAEFRSEGGKSERVSVYRKLDGHTLQGFVDTLVSLDQTALTPSNLIKDFSQSSRTGVIFKVARSLFRIIGRQSTKKTQMLRAEWEALFRLSHDDRTQQKRIEARRESLSEIIGQKITTSEKEYLAIFSLHTSYAIVLKLLAFRIVSDVNFGTAIQDFKGLATAKSKVLQAFMAALEDGEIFRQIGILNLLEGDFFSWYADPKQWSDDISEDVREVLSTLARYEDSRKIFQSENAIDLFKTLYEATVPQAVRSSLGEFYTPPWLASMVFSASEGEGRWRALDPCCGSGTFLVAAIGDLRKRSKRKGFSLADEILNRVQGIDLNPLAVLTSRVNYFIHIADLLTESKGDILIPVFLGDASDAPKTSRSNSIEFVEYKIRTLKNDIEFSFPSCLAENKPKFFRLMYDFETLVKQHQYKEAAEFIVNAGREINDSEEVEKRLTNLANAVIDLEKNEWNGIWARIVANFCCHYTTWQIFANNRKSALD